MLERRDAEIRELNREIGELRYQLKEMRDKRQNTSGLDRRERVALSAAAEPAPQYRDE
jgi:hypothetical protein